jgi:hypothetical protein
MAKLAGPFLEVSMKLKSLLTPAGVALLGLTAILSVARAADSKKADAPAAQLPPGWTAEEMERCIKAGTPGEGHAQLTKNVGTWVGKSSFWMAPGTPAVTGEVTAEYAPIMDGRFVKCDMSGECPAMGPFQGIGLFGFDNVSQKFVASLIDNHSTGIMQGTGELSEDGKTLNWTYTANCPRTQELATLRQVETNNGPKSKTLEMFAEDPKSGKEFKMMQIEFTKK